jgi:hypothetical protein
LTGSRFEACDISLSNFTACDLKSVSIDGVSIDQEQAGGWQDKAKKIMERLGINPDSQK